MGIELDFLPVGDGEKSGDAIAIRLGNLEGNRDEQKVIVIDGGFKPSGEALVEHIKKYYLTEIVDLVISTHPDLDHISGLEIVLNEMDVKCLWMHLPWNHTKNISNFFQDGRVTDNSVREHLTKSLNLAHSLEELALSKGIPIIEPFTGKSFDNNTLTVLGPDENYYESLLPDFRGTPEPKEDSGIFSSVMSKSGEFITKIAESLDIETLDDEGETAPENNTSVISLFSYDNHKMLFTGDAGIPALSKVMDLLEQANIDPTVFDFVQVPHHGSKRNVGPTLLNRMVGPKMKDYKKLKSAYVSVAKDADEKHPSKKVTNAFRRRGAPVYETRGSSMLHRYKIPIREDWKVCEPLPLYEEVDE